MEFLNIPELKKSRRKTQEINLIAKTKINKEI